MNQFRIKTIKSIFGFIIISSVLVFNFSYAKAAPTYSAETIINLTNSARAENGLGALLTNANLTSAAFAKAQDILAKDYFAHNSPEGKTPWDFINEAGYTYIYAGENLAIGFTNVSELFPAWMASPTHRENIVNQNYREIGVSVVEGEFQGAQTIVVVQEFGTRADQNIAASTPTPAASPSPGVSLTATPVANFRFIQDKSEMSPKSIFSGEEVEFKVTVSGEIQSLEAQAFGKKYNILESGSLTSTPTEKTYVLKQKIEETGSSEVRVIGVGQIGNTEAISLGDLDVKEKIITNNPSSQKTGLIAGFKESWKTNWFVYVLSMMVILAVIGIWYYRRTKVHNLAAFWRF